MEEQKKVRCAIYTRKSTDEGLDKEFNTLEALSLCVPCLNTAQNIFAP